MYLRRPSWNNSRKEGWLKKKRLKLEVLILSFAKCICVAQKMNKS